MIVSVVIPTYNSARTIEQCLRSVLAQDYPKDQVEIIVVDGGSTDDTLPLARSLGVSRILHNPLRTGEAAKALGARRSRGEILAFIDSDNLLPTADWLRRMTEPFHDRRIVCAEPIEFASAPSLPSVSRYCALLGMNDPLCLFLGNYDKHSAVTGKWTGLRVSSEDRGNWLDVELRLPLPTIGANGFLIRRDVLPAVCLGDYLFDIDIGVYLAARGMRLAKVKIGIAHLYARTLREFAQKQRRRARDYFRYRHLRVYPWQPVRLGTAAFVAATILTFPLLVQSLIGYRRKPDPAWLLHIPACWITLGVYSFETLRSLLAGRTTASDSKPS